MRSCCTCAPKLAWSSGDHSTTKGQTIDIGVIGAGNVGTALGAAWRTRGHHVTFGVRDPEDPKHSDFGAVTDIGRAAAGRDAVVLCTPWAGTQEAIVACGDLTSTVLIDCTNPLSADASGLQIGHTTSGAEQVARWAPGAYVCKAMNQIGAPLMDAPALTPTPVMFICGDDLDAKHRTAELVSQLGFEVVDAGELVVARLLEPYALLWIHLALRRGFGPTFGFALAKAPR